MSSWVICGKPNCLFKLCYQIMLSVEILKCQAHYLYTIKKRIQLKEDYSFGKTKDFLYSVDKTLGVSIRHCKEIKRRPNNAHILVLITKIIRVIWT